MEIYTNNKTMTSALYTYDALGRRIEARSFADGQLDAVRRYWYNDQWQVLTQGYWSQAYAGLALSRNYIYGNFIDEVLGFEWVLNGTPSIWYIYLHDHLYSPAAMLTEWGIVERYEYDAYGRRSVMTPGFDHRSNSHYLSDLGLTGREIDELDLDANDTPCGAKREVDTGAKGFTHFETPFGTGSRRRLASGSPRPRAVGRHYRTTRYTQTSLFLSQPAFYTFSDTPARSLNSRRTAP